MLRSGLRSSVLGAVFAACVFSGPALSAPQVISIGMFDATNTANANTKEFKTTTAPRQVIRRGQKYYFGITTNTEAPQANWTIVPSAKQMWNNAGVAILPFAGNPPFPSDDWYFKVTPGFVGFDTQEFLLEISVPPDASVGTYEFRIDALVVPPVAPTSAAPAIAVQKIFPKKVVILFNPWDIEDLVYMGDAKDRDEYIKNQNGILYRAAYKPFAWPYGQFDENTLDVLNYILDNTPNLDRTSPVAVAREISGSSNWRYWGQGLVHGNWTDDFTGGKSPMFWKSTEMVLKEYTKAGPPYQTVKFGQCWVFAGVSTSLLRCVGIPARPVSSFTTAIDNDVTADGHIDHYFSYSPVTKLFSYNMAKSIDSWWNYHVWTEAWMERTDLFGGDGWQVIDATSQTGGPGLTQIGPASRDIIAAAATPPGDDYDTEFMWSSARADYRELYESKLIPGVYGVTSTKINKDTGFGQYILTKERGGLNFSDVAADYRPAPRPSVGNSPEGQASNPYFDVVFNADETAAAGQDVHAVVTIINAPGASRTFYVTFGAALHAYNGDMVSILADPTWPVLTLAPGQSTQLPLTIPGGAIAPFLGPTEKYVRFFGAVNCDEVDTTVGIDPLGGGGGGTPITGPDVSLVLSPASPIVVGASTTAMATYVNTTGWTLTGLSAEFGVGAGLTIGGESTLTINLPDLAPGASALIPNPSVVSLAIGASPVSVSILSDQLPASSAVVWLAVTSCMGDFNGDGVVDDDDFVVLSNAYDVLDCDSPAMDAGCPADLNADGIVDDLDFQIFANAYDAYFCPGPPVR